MSALRFTTVNSIEDACVVLDEYDKDAAILSGGQSLIPVLRQRVGDYEVIIDINELNDRDYITVTEEQVQIGCLTRHKQVATSSETQNHCRILQEAATEIGDMQVKSRGTLCGSIAHADPSGDPPVIATALNAEILAESVDGSTTYNAAEFYRGFYETELEANEIVTEVRFRKIEQPTGAAYEKYEPSAGAYPVATVAAVVVLDGDEITDARVVTGAIEPGPTRMKNAEARLQDGTLTRDRVEEASIIAGEDSDPMGDSDGSAEFKSELTKTLTRRALETAVSRAGGSL